MTTTISDWVRMEEPELGEQVELCDGVPVQVLARHDADSFDVADDGGELFIVTLDNIRPLDGPYTVSSLDEDGDTHVRHFRTQHAARIYAAKQAGAVTIEGLEW